MFAGDPGKAFATASLRWAPVKQSAGAGESPRSPGFYPVPRFTHIRTQISCDKGFMKLNTPGVCFTGFLIMMEMPSDMNGLLKSMTRSRSAVIVMAAIAISASCKRRSSGSVRVRGPSKEGYSGQGGLTHSPCAPAPPPCHPSRRGLLTSRSRNCHPWPSAVHLQFIHRKRNY